MSASEALYHLYWTPSPGLKFRRLFCSAISVSMARSLFFHDALQRMLVFAGKVHHLRHFGLSYFVGVDPALADAVVMHVQHDSGGGLAVLVEEPLQHVDHKIHRRVVVV